MAPERGKWRMNIDHWGPSGWGFLMCVALAFPFAPTDADKETYRGFFARCADCLPCHICRDHMRRYLKEHPVPAESPRALVEWLQNLHNEINREADKEQWPLERMLGQFVPAQAAKQRLQLSDEEEARVAAANAEWLQSQVPAVCSPSWLVPLLAALLAAFVLAFAALACYCLWGHRRR